MWKSSLGSGMSLWWDVFHPSCKAGLLSAVQNGLWDGSSGYKMAQWKEDAVLGLGIRKLVSDLHPKLPLPMMARLAQMSVGNESLAIFFEEQRLDEFIMLRSRQQKPKADCVEALL